MKASLPADYTGGEVRAMREGGLQMRMLAVQKMLDEAFNVTVELEQRIGGEPMPSRIETPGKREILQGSLDGLIADFDRSARQLSERLEHLLNRF